MRVAISLAADVAGHESDGPRSGADGLVARAVANNDL
jgi:hypothetical protein